MRWRTTATAASCTTCCVGWRRRHKEYHRRDAEDAEGRVSSGCLGHSRLPSSTSQRSLYLCGEYSSSTSHRPMSGKSPVEDFEERVRRNLGRVMFIARWI